MGGIFACSSQSGCINELFYGTDYLSHLGTKRGGLATIDNDGIHRTIHNLENAYFRNKFEPELKELTGNMGIGVISDTDAQPIVLFSHLGKFALVMVGKIINTDELVKEIFTQNIHLSETSSGGPSPTEIVGTLISLRGSFEEGIRYAQSRIKGSCSMLLLTEKGIYVSRDKFGRTPIIIGKREDAYAASSESSAFPNLGFEIDRFVGPGEIILMTEEGVEQVQKPGEKMQICSFLWVYYGYPASSYEGINTEQVRYKCGAALARRENVKADLVGGIPDSGIGHALGFAHASGIPYMRPYVKYTPTWPRSFMPQNQKMRDLVARMKLIPIREIINNKSIIFCDDSVVRGTQLQDNVQILHEYGASEIHMRIACPCLIYPCEYLNFSTSRSTLDLAGRKAILHIEGSETAFLDEYAKDGSDKHKAMVEHICNKLKLSTLRYQTLEDLVEAIGLPKEQLCTHCWDGTGYC
ncbi:MAG TPA: amidophosphoribosyltransferase [Spirochaetota bacterium]|nr:amidophosphoribosyltransferase [Spirochaetota bacterium]HPF06408.1 amidophosphoribosyltransferase [Spirochaetota bacterium]HPJ41628.1 amidophosphoribosyltransferase [Spirochaetota bacterium]HPR36700.1 amidophosphoribosyltransferase [Spirochaetota bacterium]HRX47112.1 amidophosphoribosyltransferase [Spirochaetota bacterium]